MHLHPLQDQIESTNRLAQQRILENRLEELVRVGYREIRDSQARVDEFLNSILGRQTLSIQVGWVGWVEVGLG